MNIIEKSWKHFCIINQHKCEVFKMCCKAGIYWRGIVHDLSKYTPSEFFEYAKYYNGSISPVDKAKQEKGYCEAWLHHRGHNKHHYEYWIDNLDSGGEPLIIPYKYAMEMVCDYIGAGKVYDGTFWTIEEPYKYWKNKKKTAKIHPKSQEFFDAIFFSYMFIGDDALDKSFTMMFYDEYCR